MSMHGKKSLPYIVRKVFEIQHKLYQQHVRMCSTGRLQEALKIEEEHDFPKINEIKPEETQYYYPVGKAFKHDTDVGEQFTYSQLRVRLAGPHQLQPKPDADDLVFGKHFTDHMFKATYHKRLGGWQTPEICPMENLVIHPAAKVLHYAVELFEGMKAFRGVDGKIRLFRPEMNMARMNASAQRSGLPTFEPEEFIKCISRLVSIDQEWVPHTESASLYIRPTLIGIEPTLGVASSDSALLYTILSPVGGYFAGNQTSGVSLLADPRFTRSWPGGVGDKKMGSNYAGTIHVQKEATKQGFQQVLWLYGDDHQVTEVGTMNVFVFMINEHGERELITPPLNGLILPGIVRHSILGLAREWRNFKVTERTITMHELKKAIYENRVLEMFGAGTACVVSAIERIHYMGENLMIPTMENSDALWIQMRNTLLDIQYGRVKHPWAIEIE